MDNFTERLTTYMETLLDAGFDVQTVLGEGLATAYTLTIQQEIEHPVPDFACRQKAAEYVRKAARKLGIDRIAMTASKTPVREDHVDAVAKAVGQRLGNEIRAQFGNTGGH